jgi:peptidyl-dipeptidase Dcp
MRILGLLREGKKPSDQRAVLNPAQCRELLDRHPDWRIWVQPSSVRAIPDADYAAAGCVLTEDLSAAELILSVKEVPPAQLVAGGTHFFFSHTYKGQPYNRGLLRACLDAPVRLIDWELLRRDEQRLIGFGEYAGLVGVYEALRGWGLQRQSWTFTPALQLGRVASLKAELAQHSWPSDARVVLTGSGRVGRGAAEMLRAGGFAEVAPADFLAEAPGPCFTVLEAKEYAARTSDGGFDRREFHAEPGRYTSTLAPYLAVATVYLPCHFYAEGGPSFFTAADVLKPGNRLEFVGDISCDIAGPVPCTLRASKGDDPFYGWDPATGREVALGTPGSLGVLAVDNLPSQVPADATEGFGRAFIDQIWPEWLAGDPKGILAAATECADGELTPPYAYLAGYVSALETAAPEASELGRRIDEALEAAYRELDRLATDNRPPTFAGVTVALERMTYDLDAETTLLFNALSAASTPELQELARDVQPKLAALSNATLTNEALFARVSAVVLPSDASVEDRMLHEKTLKAFERHGARLDSAAKAKLLALDQELGTEALTFSDHLLKDTETWHLPLAEAPAGLPDWALEQAAEAAKQHGLDGGYAATLDAPNYLAFMTYAEDRGLREQLWRAYAQRGARGDERDNRLRVLNLAAKRLERAQLLGFASHADYVLAERMASTPETVHAFLADLRAKARPAAEREAAELRAFAARELGLHDLQRWDVAFTTERYKLAVLDFDDAVTKPYFALPKVEAWAFDVARRLYGLEVKPAPHNPTYHPDAQAWEVWDSAGQFIAHLTTDWHPRKGKRAGAWMTSYRSAFADARGREVRPVVSLVGNFSKPTAEAPALLTFNEVLTLFHEFGHGLHGMLGRGSYASLTGTSVRWDFVELPSQIMENWCYEPAELAQWAKHYATGEAMPAELVARLAQSQTFLEGLATLRQLGFGLLDMAWHGARTAPTDLEQLEREAFASVDLWPAVDSSYISPSFSHIFAGGYSAGYYSYKWAEVLDADAYGFFREAPDQAAPRFRALLEAGGTVDPMDLYVAFRGRRPQPEALLRRAGLLTPTA